ncbi:MAG: Hvo_1808 family surface protein [Halorhabdus sp.]
MTACIRVPIVVLAAVLVLQPALAVTTVATPATMVESPIADQHPDPETDVLGWEDDYWYNETISVTPDDGLNDSELDAVVARGMARVEQIRRLEFEQTPPVQVISREDYRRRVDNRTSNMTDAQRLHQNVKYEALFMVDESTDATDVQADNLAGGVGGFYDPSSGEIKIVSESASTPKMDEITLAQELFHALQDQRFNISSFNQSTRELHNARDGIIEGDGNYVDYLYQQRCENEWDGTCIMPSDGGAPSDFSPHYGLYQIMLQPYSDGPVFVRAIRNKSGWEGVNAVYANPPASTEQTIHPATYEADDPTNVTVPDRSNDDWRPLDVENGVDYAAFGEAGLYVTLWYPAMQSQGTVSIIPLQNHINFAAGGVQQVDPYNYNHSYTAGWDGDKLVPYVTDESFRTNETGYVYTTVWDSPADAAEFRTGYEHLLELHGAEPVDSHVNTYRIPEETSGFSDAFYLNQTGDTFTIVNAPTVEDLSAVWADAAPASETTTDETPSDSTTTDTATTAATTVDTTTTVSDTDTDTLSGSDDSTTAPAGDATTTAGPGFTLVVGSVALLVVAVGSLRRR